jgi:hypothetical protein
MWKFTRGDKYQKKNFLKDSFINAKNQKINSPNTLLNKYLCF